MGSGGMGFWNPHQRKSRAACRSDGRGTRGRRNGVTGGVGFLMAIVLFASIREKLRFAEYPKSFEGFPIALITAGLMALAFMGFSGLKIW